MKACDSIGQFWAGFWSSNPGLGDNIYFSNHCWWSLVTSAVSERGIHTIRGLEAPKAGSSESRNSREKWMIENNDSVNLGASCWLVGHLWRHVSLCWWLCQWLVSFFQIESLPPELFQCRKLRTLHLGNNVLQSLPSRVGELMNLSQIELRGNRLECLPVELGECPLLKRSGLVVEEDLFNTLPLEVKERLWRADKEQAWTPEKREKPLIN